VPDHDAIVHNEWPGALYLRWIGGSVPVTAVLSSTVLAVGPSVAITRSGEVRSLAGCGDADDTRCFALVGSVGHEIAAATWGDGAFYLRSGAVFERFEPSTGTLTPLDAALAYSQQLAYDAWSDSVVYGEDGSGQLVIMPAR
jgi:hypothetical protein